MKKYFVCGDVHSFYTYLKEALDNAGFDLNNDDHVFVSCGDLFDRGNETLECLNFVNSLPDNRKILIRGNHEDLLEDCLKKKTVTYTDFHNGTLNTIMQIVGLSETSFWFMSKEELSSCFDDVSNNKDLQKYFDSLVDYKEVGDYMFVHGWFPLSSNWDESAWKIARWCNGIAYWFNNERMPNKTVVCGHWHCSYGNKRIGLIEEEFPTENIEKAFTPFIQPGIIALDGCTVYSRKVNVVVLEI